MDVLLEQLAVVVDESCYGVLGQHSVANLALHRTEELVRNLLLQGKSDLVNGSHDVSKISKVQVENLLSLGYILNCILILFVYILCAKKFLSSIFE